MKKGIVLGLMLPLIVVSVFAGGGGQQQSTRTGPSGITMRLLTDATGIDDRSFNAAAWRGILEFYGDTWQNARQRGASYDVVTAQTQDMYIPVLRQATDEQYDLIVTTGFTWADALSEVAAAHPNQQYLMVDVDWLGPLPNVIQAVFSEHEGSYLVGAAAALKAKADGIVNPRFGFIGGIPGATITKFEVGYVQGILSVIPDAQIVDFYANDWGNPGLAKTQAKFWYDAGVYAIYSAAGYTGNGTIAQAKEYRSQGKNVWAVGVDSDMHEEGLYDATHSAVLTSMLKQVEASVIYALNAVKNKTFRGEIITLDLKRDGVGYATTNTEALTPEIVRELERIKGRIIAGDITIAATHAAARRLPGFPQDLKALDD